MGINKKEVRLTINVFRIGVAFAVIGGLLALVGPLLDNSTSTTTIGPMVYETTENMVGPQPIGYLCVAGGVLALLMGILVVLRPKFALIGALLLAISVILIFTGSQIAASQGMVDLGSGQLEGGVAAGAGAGAVVPTSFDMETEIGGYCLGVGSILVALAVPLIALKKK